LTFIWFSFCLLLCLILYWSMYYASSLNPYVDLYFHDSCSIDYQSQIVDSSRHQYSSTLIIVTLTLIHSYYLLHIWFCSFVSSNTWYSIPKPSLVSFLLCFSYSTLTVVPILHYYQNITLSLLGSQFYLIQVSSFSNI